MFGPVWHVGLVVADVDKAKAELTDALGLEWLKTVERAAGAFSYRGTFSEQGPPHLELIEGSPGSPWDASGGSRLDHVAVWVDDVADARRRLEERGMPVVLDGGEFDLPHMNYHAAPEAGLRIETVDVRRQPVYRELFGH